MGRQIDLTATATAIVHECVVVNPWPQADNTIFDLRSRAQSIRHAHNIVYTTVCNKFTAVKPCSNSAAMSRSYTVASEQWRI